MEIINTTKQHGMAASCAGSIPTVPVVEHCSSLPGPIDASKEQ
jgi:hypothetical protein